jgi:ABC-type multidrug transport system fused ATPase/permease subunit
MTDTNQSQAVPGGAQSGAKPMSFKNKKILRKATTQYVDVEKVQKDAEELLETGDSEKVLNEKYIFKQKNVGLLQIYKHFFEPVDWILFILAIIGAIGSGISMPLMSYLMSEVYSDVGNTSEARSQEELIEIMRQTVEDSMNDQIKKQLLYGGIMFVLTFLCEFCWSLLGDRLSYNLKKRYFQLILAQEQSFFDANNAFQFSTKVQTQISQISAGVGSNVGSLLSTICRCILGFVFAFMASWKLTLVLLCMAPVILFFGACMIVTLRKGLIFARKIWEMAGGIAEEMLYNIKTIASFANFEFELKKFHEKVELCLRLDLINSCKLGFALGIVIFFLNLTIFIGFLYGRTLIGKDFNSNRGRDFTGGDVTQATSCTLTGITGLGIIGPSFKSISESCAAASDYFSILERKPLVDLSRSVEMPPKEYMKGDIVFDNVSFYYPSDPAQKPILNGLTLRFPPGQKVALVGESGCGKSTTVNLIERLYDTTGGTITIDGLDIKNFDIRYLRSLIGYVQQEPVLFNKSIKDNIIFGREDSLSSLGNIDEMVNDACNDARATRFIDNLPDKLDYKVGIKGSKLSGGQKQRVAIARAILGKPKIMILDEATSALDNKAEKQVQAALDHISKKNVTTIIIAHRLSTIKNADIIYALKGGKVYEQGTHKELLAKGGYYASLVKSQLAQDEIESQNEREELLRKKTTIKKRTTDEEVQFVRKDKEICLEKSDVEVHPCYLFEELEDQKCNIFLACLGAAILGALSPVNGLMMAKAINALNSRYQTIRYDEGLKYSLIFLLFAFLQGIGNCLMTWKFGSLGQILACKYRKKLLRKYLGLHLSFFDVNENSPGALMTKMSLNTLQLNQIMQTILGVSVQCASVLIVGLVLGCYYEYRLTLINFCFVPFIVALNIIRRETNMGTSRRALDANAEAGGILSECVLNTKSIFSFNFQPSALRMYLDALEWTKRQFCCDALLGGLFGGLATFASFAGNAAVYAAAKEYILDGSIDSEDMNIAMSVVGNCVSGVSSGLSSLANLKQGIIGYKSIYCTLETESTIPPFRRDNEDKIPADNIQGKIELKHVYFAYPTRPDNVILKDVSLVINPGEQTAFVGYSGSGKSTVIQLLCRFYDVEDGKGEVLIDDVNIKDYNLYQLRKKIGLVQQEPPLFKVSVLENVRYGKLDATDEECIEAAREASIMKFFTKDKINEVIGGNQGASGGKTDPVSGGEKQRLAIARVFLKNPKILLLDEATSALDRDSEIEVQKSLDKLAANRTSVSIAHRLTTIEGCDKIFVLENGRLVEQGNHEELMNLKKKYYILHKFSTI